MVTVQPRQYDEIPKNFDPIRPSDPLTTRQTPTQEEPRPKYQPPQRNNDQNFNNFNNFNERNFSLNDDSSTVFPLPALSQIAFNHSFNYYEHLRLEWTESETKWEYIARYSRLQSGLWMASAPQRKY